MKNFNKWFDRVFSKANVLVGSLVISIGSNFFAPHLGVFDCGISGCFGPNGDLFSTFLPTTMVIAGFTLLTYLLKNGVFRAWIRFAIIWLIFSAIYIANTSHDTNNALGMDGKPLTIGFTAATFIIFSVVFILISIVPVYKLNK
jgi:hypothetical protein